MRKEFVQSPDEARRRNAKQVIEFGKGYATAGLAQLAMCRHQQENPCDGCKQCCDDMHYFAIAFAVIDGAAVDGKSAELYELLTKFAVENLDQFPPQLLRPLYGEEIDFPEYIEEISAGGQNDS